MARRKRQNVHNGEVRRDAFGISFLVLSVNGKMCHLRQLGYTQPFQKLTEVVKNWQCVKEF